MGLLDSVIGALGQSQGVGGVSGGPGGQAELISAVIGMLGQGGGQGGLGGLAGLVAKMQQGGLGDVAASWVGTGQNQPIQPDQLGQVLGGDMLGQLGQQLGMNQGDLLGQLSQMLPQVVDKLTPQGQIPQGDIAGMLGGQQGGQGGAGGLGDLAGMLGGLLNKR
jgi:uncharacterized protein YidB (DUF937 family)